MPSDGTGNVEICQGDTIQWQVHTATPPGTKKGHLHIYQGDCILDDGTGHGTKTKWFAADEGAYTKGGTTDSSVPTDTTYLYSIAVVDDHDGHVYAYDPQIVIGTGQRLHKHPQKKGCQ